jgi:hypothetical protein
MHDQNKPTGFGDNEIQRALAAGLSDEGIIALIIEHTRVAEGDARQILAREKGEFVDDVIDVADDPSFPSPRRTGQR